MVVATSIIGSRLDYCNALLAGNTTYNLQRLQRLQTYAAKIVLKDYKHAQTRQLTDLHWLPIPLRIQYKTSLLAFKSVHNGNPKYISDMLLTYSPSRTLRSSSQFLLEVPKTKSALHDRAFSVFAPKTFNSLTDELRKMAFDHSQTTDSHPFCHLLKRG